jgi:glycerophosphoryl diester phosphodiesterase
LSVPLYGQQSTNQHTGKLVIAHRGASGYLPEHTLAAKVLAHAMGADYIEQDLVLTQDDQLVVLHDLYLDRVTDVAKVFPGRQRADGHFYAIDFTLAEIRQLSLSERFTAKQGQGSAVFPNRFPLGQARFTIATFAEEIELIQGLNQTLGRAVGLYPELKAPWFHHQEGRDIARRTLATLQQYGYTRRQDPVFLQSFDAHELQRIKRDLLPEFGMTIKLVQLIAKTDWKLSYEKVGADWRPYSYDWMLQADAMPQIAAYADGIGPWLPMVISAPIGTEAPKITSLVSEAHAAGLQVHPYTLRQDRLPDYAQDFEHLLALVYQQADADGAFTDFPDKAVQFLRTK